MKPKLTTPSNPSHLAGHKKPASSPIHHERAALESLLLTVPPTHGLSRRQMATRLGVDDDYIDRAINLCTQARALVVGSGTLHQRKYRLTKDRREQLAPPVTPPVKPPVTPPPTYRSTGHYTGQPWNLRPDAEAHKQIPSLRDGVRVPYCQPKPMLVGRTGTIAWMPGRLG